MTGLVSERPYALSIAGFDPSGGAGVLADCKTFESNGVYGFAVCTALTYQNDNSFEGLEWQPFETIAAQLSPLAKFDIKVGKIGLVRDMRMLDQITEYARRLWPSIRLVWDPVAAASAGFTFHTSFADDALKRAMSRVALVTPNLSEAVLFSDGADPTESAQTLSYKVPVLLKGGHAGGELSDDVLFVDGNSTTFSGARLEKAAKHGSGCVLSSAIAAFMALGRSLPDAVEEARHYVRRFLTSSETLLGFHKAA